MGMGKTVEIIALLLANPPAPAAAKGAGKAAGSCKATLVVAPVSLLGQWRDEIQQFSDLRVRVHHGAERSKSAAELGQYDVVLTSYGTVSSEGKDFLAGVARPAPLMEVDWFRVVLDEAHSIRNKGTDGAKTVFALTAERRWCVTGTPVQNKLDDLFSLLHFLKEEPWSSAGWWSKMIAKPFEQDDPAAVARLRTVLGPLVLRRTKDMRDSRGNPILELPPRTESILFCTFSETEKDFYSAVFTKSQTKLEGFLKQGVVLNRYVQILTLLLRLRQTCDHPYLVLGRARSTDEFAAEIQRFLTKFTSRLDLSDPSGPSLSFVQQVTASIRSLATQKHNQLLQPSQSLLPVGPGLTRAAGSSFSTPSSVTTEGLGTEPSSEALAVSAQNVAQLASVEQEPEVGDDSAIECVICLSPFERPALLECAHVFCRECVEPMFNGNGNMHCPICRRLVNRARMLDVPEPETLDYKNDWKHSAKTLQLLEAILALRRDRPADKAIIFSQWTAMLDLCEVPLEQHGIPFLRLDGSMSQKQREAVLYKFRGGTFPLLLISLKAGGVGLNLVTANVVYFLDCWWNPAVEDQAIQRVHRIGQTKPVEVFRFVVRGTVEERILELQSRKRSLASSIGLDKSDGNVNKLSMADLTSLFSVSSFDKL
jgi:DNA repair protein RAD5